MELRHLRYFLALADELHFGRAAQRLAISQPPLTVAIQQLEAEVGAPLFLRNSRGVQLTAAGLALVPRARALINKAGEALREARDVAAGQAGRLIIGFAGTMLYRGLPRMLLAFQAEHPRLALNLAGQPLAVVSRAVSPDYHERILAVFGEAGAATGPVHELQHWLNVVSLVAQGLAVALVPAALKQAGIAGAAFVPLAGLAGEPPRYDTHCLWKTGADLPALALFLRAVADVARG